MALKIAIFRVLLAWGQSLQADVRRKAELLANARPFVGGVQAAERVRLPARVAITPGAGQQRIIFQEHLLRLANKSLEHQ
jgi:hypothetical protein